MCQIQRARNSIPQTETTSRAMSMNHLPNAFNPVLMAFFTSDIWGLLKRLSTLLDQEQGHGCHMSPATPQKISLVAEKKVG